MVQHHGGAPGAAPRCTAVYQPALLLCSCGKPAILLQSPLAQAANPHTASKIVAGSPAAGSTIEKTTRTRVIPAGSTPEPFKFWEYLENVGPGDADRLILYVYRDDPNPSIQVGKFTYPFNDIPWNDQEEAEAMIAQKWGGRTFRVIVKNGSQRMGIGRIYINAAPKSLMPQVDTPATPYQAGPGYPPGYPAAASGYPAAPGYDPYARVAETAIHTVANQERQAVEIGISALKSAAEVMQLGKAQPTNAMDDLTRQFMTAMIAKMANPPDPLESFTKMLALMKELNPTPNSGIPGLGGTVVDKLLTTIIDRGMNPTPAGPATSMGAELVRVLPQVAQYVSKGIEDYARITEAQRDAMMAQRGAVPGQVVTRPGPQPVPLRPAAAAATPPPAADPVQTPANGQEGMAMFMNPQDFLEQKIIEIFNEKQSAEAAAEEALAFLDRMSPDIVPQLVVHGEQGLMALFNTRPILKPALSNPARVSEFVRAFIKFANEPPAGEAAPPPAAG